MVDSCSNVSIVSLPLARKHGLVYEKVCFPITQVNSSSSTVGRFTIPFTFHNHTIQATFIVLENIPQAIIVGTDIGRSFFLTTNLDTLQVLFSLPPKPYVQSRP